MASNTTSFLLPEEHRIISSWLEVEPKEDIPEELTLEKALENLGLNQEVSVHSTTDFAVATILLERVQQYLPQWASVSEEKVTLGRNYRDRAARRTVELTPKSLLTINWADSGPGFSWPEEYSVTYVPLYDVYAVTGSVDSTDVYGVTDFALGYFVSSEEVLPAATEIVKAEWRNLTNTGGQERWAYLFDTGLIDGDLADTMADEVWSEDESEAENEEETTDGITAAIKAAYPNLTDEEIEDLAQAT